MIKLRDSLEEVVQWTYSGQFDLRRLNLTSLPLSLGNIINSQNFLTIYCVSNDYTLYRLDVNYFPIIQGGVKNIAVKVLTSKSYDVMENLGQQFLQVPHSHNWLTDDHNYASLGYITSPSNGIFSTGVYQLENSENTIVIESFLGAIFYSGDDSKVMTD